jgi:hypothetical protein
VTTLRRSGATPLLEVNARQAGRWCRRRFRAGDTEATSSARFDVATVSYGFDRDALDTDPVNDVYPVFSLDWVKAYSSTNAFNLAAAASHCAET